MRDTYFWLIIDPPAGDEIKIVAAPSKLDALHAAATEWSYEEGSNERDAFIKEARITPLSDAQAKSLGLEATGDPMRTFGVREVAVMTVEQILSAALEPHGVVIRPMRSSNRLKWFLARRDYPHRGVYAQPPPYDLSSKHPWPKKAQVEDSRWLDDLVSTILTELDAHKARREL
jgi:hypothetical protein